MERQISLSVPSYVNEFVGGRQATFYLIKVKVSGSEWEVKRRYKEFADLRKELLTNMGNLPAMPGKTLFKVRKPEDIEKRRAGLQAFLEALVSRQDVYCNELFLSFLKVLVLLILNSSKRCFPSARLTSLVLSEK